MSKIVQIDGKWYDFGTKNASFLLTAQELKTLGIKNFYFMLEVKYPQLGVQDIDPFDPNISSADIGKVIVECQANPWYFFREVSRVPARGAPQNFRIYLHRASCAAIWCFKHNIDFLLCQPRQTYKTTILLAITTYSFIFKLKNVDIPFMHIKEKDTLRNAEMFRDYIDALPPYMNPWYGKTKPPGLKSLRYEEHGTNIAILSSADSDVKAKDKMRGMTLFLSFIDEWEYINYIGSVISGAAPAIISGRRIARETGGLACMMYSSTPGDLETDTGMEAQRIIDATPPFFEQLYDMTDEEVEAFLSGARAKVDSEEDSETVSEEELVTTLYIEFDYKQLRKDESYLKEQYIEANRSGKLAEYRRGVLLDRFRGGDAVLFEQTDIDYIKNHVKQPSHDIFIMNKFHLYTYDHEILTFDLNSDTPYYDIHLPYLIGIDVSAGGDGDNTAICIVHPYTLQVVGELQSPYIGLIDLMKLVVCLAKLLPTAIFCVETNSVGKAIVDFVQETNLEHRFYHDPSLDISKNPLETRSDSQHLLETKAKAKQYIGTYVTSTVRKNMMDLLKRHVKDYKELLNTRYLVKDITNLVKGKNGKIQACSGEHDDMVMAYLHTLYVLYYGFDLTRFGIDKNKCKFEMVYEVLDDYQREIQEETVNNVVPYSTPTMYEQQLLSELIDPSSYGSITANKSEDIYGYKPSDYNTRYRVQEQTHTNEEGLSRSDLLFMQSVNNWGW